MKPTISLMALTLGLSLTGAVWAQNAAPADTAAPAADAGAAVSGNAPQAADTPAPADQAVEDKIADAPAEAADGTDTMPNGQSLTPVTMENGRWLNDEGIPVYKIEADGTVDYATFSGYRRYSAECHVCHGPDGEGSTYAPALKKSVLRIGYYDFQQIVASGKQDVSSAQNQVMPAFATNKNVWCYIDDIYTYLVARGTDAIPRGRPAKKADKPGEFTEIEDACMAM